MPDLSVVLITKNQQWNVPRLVESVLERTASYSSREIMLVDSASSDKTVDEAARYPIQVIRLPATQRLTAAAGRYIGYKQTTGENVLFLDGDMELCEGWLEKALDVLQQDSKIAVVTGQVIDRPINTPRSDIYVVEKTDGPVKMIEVGHGGGAALYRRAVLDEVGPFNPYIYSDEEPELCIRIRQRGYRVVELDYPAVCHYSDPFLSITTLLKRWRRNLYIGLGQNLRSHLGDDLFWVYLKERGFGCLPGIAITAGVFSLLLSLFSQQILWFGLWVLGLIAFIGLLYYRKRNLYWVMHTLVRRLLMTSGTVQGFLIKPLKPDTYPVDSIEFIKPTEEIRSDV